MEELMQRIDIFRQCNMVDDVGYKDILAVVSLLKDEYHLKLTDENTGVMLTHLVAAFRRIKEGEAVDPLDPEIVAQTADLPYYDQALEIRNRILSVMQNQLSPDEQDFVLVHVCTMLSFIYE